MASPLQTTGTGTVPELTLPLRLLVSRLRAGLDQGDMAATLRCGIRTIGRYEKGQTTPRLGDLVLWADRTGTLLEWLVGDNTESGASAAGEPRSRCSTETDRTTRRLSVVGS
jgi:transcriptional regulator with XRE-family HTH domain